MKLLFTIILLVELFILLPGPTLELLFVSTCLLTKHFIKFVLDVYYHVILGVLELRRGTMVLGMRQRFYGVLQYEILLGASYNRSIFSQIMKTWEHDYLHTPKAEKLFNLYMWSVFSANQL